MKAPWFPRVVRSSFRSAVRPRLTTGRPAVECLEDRTVLSTVFVVPIGQTVDATHRHSLVDALSFAVTGDSIVVEPGATQDVGTVNVALANITIQGDPGITNASLPRYDLSINASQVTLTNLNLGTVTLSATAQATTVSSSHLINFVETGAATGAGHNTLRHNVITGSVDLQGNSDPGQQTIDLVDSNEFFSSQAVVLKLTNSNSTTIQHNHINSDASGGVGIQVRSNSDNVIISGNVVEMMGAGVPFAVVLVNTGGATGNLLSAKVINNELRTNGTGTGLYCNLFGTGAKFIAQIEGNELNRNLVGVDINGLAGATGAGNIDLGAGSNAFGVSKGANNFRGFDGQSGHFAINLHNTDAGITVFARQNIFDNGATLSSVVRDGGNGGGSGVLDTSQALDANHAYVQSLFTELLGRPGDLTAGGEVDQWVAKLSKGHRVVAKGILFSTESLSRIVNDVYSHYLDRDATPAEIATYAKQLKAGKSITSIEAAVLGSVESQAHIRSDFVQAVYGEVLHRTATPAELTAKYKSIQLLGLKGVAASITGSKERRMNAVTDFYTDFLHRAATTDEATALVKKSGSLLNLELVVLSGDDYFSHG